MTTNLSLSMALLCCLPAVAAFADNGPPAPASPPVPSAASAPTVVSRTVKQVAPGVTWTQEIDSDPPLIINVVAADLDAPGVRAEVGPAQDHVGGDDPTGGREDVSRYARRHLAVAAVNGDFFPFTGDPLGIEIHAGELISEPWIGNGKGGPRSVLGVTPDGHAIVDRLGYLGDLQAADGSRLRVGGVDRQVGKNEIVVMTPTYAGTKVNRAGGTDAVVTGVNLPLRANKLMIGTVGSVRTTPDGTDTIPANGLILAGGPGTGGAALQAHVHPGDQVRFVLCVGSVANPAAGVQVAVLPRDTNDMPSRAGDSVDPTALVWGGVTEAIGGGPRLLTGGVTTIDGIDEGFDPGFVGYTYPRTAVGTSDGGRWLYLLTVDGRQTISQGVSLGDMAAILRRYGATDAINLDGGGSTTMAVDGITVDSPGGAGNERPVADMLVITSDEGVPGMPNWDNAGDSIAGDPPQTGSVQLSAARDHVAAGQTMQISVSDGDAPVDPASADMIWQGPVRPAAQPAAAPLPVAASQNGGESVPASTQDNGDPIGFIDQRGVFTAIRSGTGIVTAFYRGQMLTLPVTVGAGQSTSSFNTLRAELAPDPSEPGVYDVLSIHAVNGAAPLAGIPVVITVTGGSVDNAAATTDADGSATVHITWDKPSGGGLVTVSSQGLATVTLGQP